MTLVGIMSTLLQLCILCFQRLMSLHGFTLDKSTNVKCIFLETPLLVHFDLLPKTFFPKFEQQSWVAAYLPLFTASWYARCVHYGSLFPTLKKDILVWNDGQKVLPQKLNTCKTTGTCTAPYLSFPFILLLDLVTFCTSQGHFNAQSWK